MLAAQPAPGTGNDGHTIIKTTFCHDAFLLLFPGPLHASPEESLDRTGNEFFHDFVGAAVDTVGTSVDIGAGDGVLEHVAVTTV